MSDQRLVELSGLDLEKADLLLDRANHDVAKYMAMTARNVDMATIDDELAEMVKRDVTCTDGQRSAWSLWEPLGRELSELARDPAVAEIDATMVALAELVERWGSDSTLLGDVVNAARRVAEQISTLRRDVRRRLMEVGR